MTINKRYAPTQAVFSRRRGCECRRDTTVGAWCFIDEGGDGDFTALYHKVVYEQLSKLLAGPISALNAWLDSSKWSAQRGKVS
jgi:hypothetical protein